MTQYRKPFYANEMHNDSNFSVHRYFTTNIQRQGRSKLKEFVDLPSPFGVQNTYKYLRRANLNKLPFLTQFKPKKEKTFVPLHTHISKKDSRSFTCHYSNKSFSSLSQHKKSQYIVKVCMFSQISQIKDFSSHCIEIDIMKYLRNCFLKCKLHLQNLTLQEYRQIQKWILPTIKNRNQKRQLQSSLVLLGVLQMKKKQDLINKLKRLNQQQKINQIYQLIEYFFIPDDEIIIHQLESMLQQINKIYKFKKIVNVDSIQNIFLLDGTLVQCLFQLTTFNPIVIGTSNNVNSYQLQMLRQSLKNQIKQQEKNARQNWIKSIVKAERLRQDSKQIFATKPKSYDDIDISLKKKRAKQIRTSIKDKFNLMKIKAPFIGKQDLVKQYDIFNI